MRRCSGASKIVMDGAYLHRSLSTCERGGPACVSCMIHDLAMVFGCGNAPMQVRMGKDSVRM